MTTKASATTTDLGLMIRDFTECRWFDTFDIVNGDYEMKGPRQITEVDISDPDNPVVYLDNGQTFTIRIIAGGGL